MRKILLILPITLLILSCTDVNNNYANSVTKNVLSSEIAYKNKIHNKIYFESDAYKMILFAMKKEQILKPHSAPMDTPLLILEGEAKVTINEESYVLKSGESIILPKNIDHAVYPIMDTKFVLIK